MARTCSCPCSIGVWLHGWSAGRSNHFEQLVIFTDDVFTLQTLGVCRCRPRCRQPDLDGGAKHANVGSIALIPSLPRMTDHPIDGGVMVFPDIRGPVRRMYRFSR